LTPNTKTYDIAIIGAGPAGCAAALGLGRSGLKVALIDKARFPREKTCGDAIPGPALKTLEHAFPFFQDAFFKLKEKHRIKMSSIMLENRRSINYYWKLPAYNIKRIVFDQFLLDLVRQHTNTEILEGWSVKNIEHGNPMIIHSERPHERLSAKMIIGAGGARSITRQDLQESAISNQPSVMATRAYFKGLKLSENANFFYVLKKYLPGYFWVFPLGNDVFNVGFGMKTDRHGKVSLKMKDALEEFIRSDSMQDVFTGTEQISEFVGAMIPIGGKRGSYSGEGYLLAGDAANLADPLQGHGIDKAIVSGLLAGHQANKCFQADDFSAEFIAYYDLSIKSGIERELRKNRHRLILLSNFPSLLNLYAFVKR